MVHRQPGLALLKVRANAIWWERDGLPAGVRGHSYSVPSVVGVQYGIRAGCGHSTSCELKEMLRQQQEQLTQLTQCLAALQSSN